MGQHKNRLRLGAGAYYKIHKIMKSESDNTPNEHSTELFQQQIKKQPHGEFLEGSTDEASFHHPPQAPYPHPYHQPYTHPYGFYSQHNPNLQIPFQQYQPVMANQIPYQYYHHHQNYHWANQQHPQQWDQFNQMPHCRRGRGRGRGRGWHHRFHENPHSRQKGEDRGQWQGKKKNCSSSSSSSDDLKSMEKQLRGLDIGEKKMSSKAIKVEQFRAELLPFIERYSLSDHLCRKLMNYLLKRYDDAADLAYLKQTLSIMEQESFHYFDTPYLNLFSISREIIKNGFNIRQINGRLDKKLFLKNKRHHKDVEFYRKYPNPIPIKFLESEDLLDLDLSQTVFLVDGNNMMQKNKIFRKFFDSPDEKDKSEGQVRLQWLLGETLNSELFLDNCYGNEAYSDIKASILNKEAAENTEKIPVYFADKYLSTEATADDKIVDRLAEIVMSKEYQGKKIVLVSADRELAQRCAQITEISQSSGHYLFKFCKQVIRKKYYSRPQMKGIIKRIFTF